MGRPGRESSGVKSHLIDSSSSNPASLSVLSVPLSGVRTSPSTKKAVGTRGTLGSPCLYPQMAPSSRSRRTCVMPSPVVSAMSGKGGPVLDEFFGVHAPSVAIPRKKHAAMPAAIPGSERPSRYAGGWNFPTRYATEQVTDDTLATDFSDADHRRP